VADTAIFRSGQMVGVFAPCGNPIVAGRAATGDTRMIKHAGGKTVDAMTHPAILGGGDMRGRLA
jgi:hypothetical protein